MSTKKKWIYAVALLCLAIGVLFVLAACEENYKYEVWYEYTAYFPAEGDHEAYTVRSNKTLRTDKAEGNVLEISGERIVPPDGYTFGGFKTFGNEKIFDENLKQVEGVKLTEDIKEIDPIWVPIEYTLVFAEKEENGRLHINNSKTFTLKTGENFQSSQFYSPVPYEYNKEFVGWIGNVDSPDLVYNYTDYSSLFGVVGFVDKHGYFKHETSYIDQNGETHTGNFIIFRAVYDNIKHSVTLDYNKSGVKDVQIEAINDTLLPDLSKHHQKQNGMRVYGFSVSPTEYIPFTDIVTTDITLYAFWENYKTVTLHYSDKDTGTFDIFEISDNTLPYLDHKPNHTFGGWYENSDLAGLPAVNPTFSEAKDHYYAKWNGKEYTLTFETNGGDALEGGTYIYGEGTPLPIPEKYHHNFLGWCMDREMSTTPMKTMPLEASGHYTLYAKWETSSAISAKEDLLAIINNPAGGYYLTCDINLDGETWTPIPAFTGTLEGNGFTIKNFSLKATAAAESYAFIAENHGVISNLSFKDMSIGYYNVKNAGVIAGKNYGTILNCHVISKATDLSAYALQYNYSYHTSDRGTNLTTVLTSGMIAGYNGQGGVISGCTASTPVKVTYNAQNTNDGGAGNVDMIVCCGEICGRNDGTIRNCQSEREISLTGSSYCDNGKYNTLLAGYLTIHTYLYIGGVAGQNCEGAVMEKCVSSTSLDSTIGHRGNADGYVFGAVGGVTGYNAGRVSTCYADAGTLSGEFPHLNLNKVGVGGVAGINLGTGKIENCYASNMTIVVRNITTGGFLGTNLGIVQTSYAVDIELRVEVTANTWFIGGFVGYNHTTASIKNCVCRVTLNMPASIAYSQQFAGDTVGVLMSCFYSDESKLILGGAEQTELIPDSHAAVREDEVIFSHAFLVEELYWNEQIWQIDGEQLPVLK